MMITVRKQPIAMALLCALCAGYWQNTLATPITQDTSCDEDYIDVDRRIKQVRYFPNQVYLMVVHFGFQSSIEFDKGEWVENIILGDNYSWKITPLNNLLFIRPMEKNINTNMTVITNKNRYLFDLVSKDFYDYDEDQITYSMKFNYPKKPRKNVQ